MLQGQSKTQDMQQCLILMHIHAHLHGTGPMVLFRMSISLLLPPPPPHTHTHTASPHRSTNSLQFKFCCAFFTSQFNTSLPLVGNSGHLTWVRHSSSKSSATYSYQCVQYFRVFKQLFGCLCLGFSTCSQMLKHAIARGCYLVFNPFSVMMSFENNP